MSRFVFKSLIYSERIGAAAGSTRAVDRVSATAICISGLVIFTTIHAQDFADVVGDSTLGRRTFPIVAPRLSRTVTLLSMTAWSLFLAWFWGIGPLSSCVFVALGVVIAGRYYRLRNPAADKLSYVLYNVSDARFVASNCS